jgi:hypothetical protein
VKRQRGIGCNKRGADGHTTMHDETHPCVAWEI